MPRQYRAMRIERQATEDDNRFAFALSSEQPADQWFGREVLKHDSKSIRQDRLKGGVPLLFNHNTDQHMGVVDGYSVKDGCSASRVNGAPPHSRKRRNAISTMESSRMRVSDT